MLYGGHVNFHDTVTSETRNCAKCSLSDTICHFSPVIISREDVKYILVYLFKMT